MAAVSLALVLDGRPRVLLMRRSAKQGDPWSGQISLPGGHQEPEDEDLLATAIRETREELGLDLSGMPCLGSLAARRARARGAVLDLGVVPYVFALEREVPTVASPEAEEAFWLSLERAGSGALDDQYVHAQADGTRLEFPAWNLEGRIIWGMTHRILSDLLLALGPPRGL